MKTILRFAYYLLNNIRINLFVKKVRVSLNCMIKPKTYFEGYNHISSSTYFRGYLGKYSYIGQKSTIDAFVGRFCSIGENVSIVSSEHPINYVSTSPVFYSLKNHCGRTFSKTEQSEDIKQVVINGKAYNAFIGNDVWIGSNVMIKSGIRIGDGAVVGMGAVVTKDVPPYSIVAGVPAKIIRYRFDHETIEKLLQISWWNFSDPNLIRMQQFINDTEAFFEEFKNG